MKRSFIAAACLCATCMPVHARLGAAPDLPAPNDSFSSYAAAGYTRRDSTLETGTRISEFVSSSGNVFAVSWRGPIIPDLKALLGSYFGPYTAEAAKLPAAGNSQLSIERPDLVVQSGGRMKAFSGRAWLPAQLPPGFDISLIN